MFDTRHPKELVAIKVLCEAQGIDPTDWLADPKVDLLELGKRLNFIAAARAAISRRL